MWNVRTVIDDCMDWEEIIHLMLDKKINYLLLIKRLTHKVSKLKEGKEILNWVSQKTPWLKNKSSLYTDTKKYEMLWTYK